ncbi:HipA family kinase [Pedobacter miscanthi]|nr:HipA family kinase [Pedobacter miscanthi]
MKQLQTIQEVHKMFNTTGSNPLLVTCNDLNDWVCKYDKFPNYLFNELVASEFGKLWGINIPETSLIKVKREHVPVERFPKLQLNLFDKDCFGSLYIENTKEIDLTFTPLFKEKSFRDKVLVKSDFLKIALFDLWLANEDRNYNNNNLLMHYAKDNSLSFYAIDHVAIFNSSFLNYGIQALTENESILNTDLARLLFANDRKLGETVNKLIENFYLCTKDCETSLVNILALVPNSWAIDTVEIRSKIEQYLFNDAWKKQCEDHFRAFIHSLILS